MSYEFIAEVEIKYLYFAILKFKSYSLLKNSFIFNSQFYVQVLPTRKNCYHAYGVDFKLWNKYVATQFESAFMSTLQIIKKL